VRIFEGTPVVGGAKNSKGDDRSKDALGPTNKLTRFQSVLEVHYITTQVIRGFTMAGPVKSRPTLPPGFSTFVNKHKTS